MKIRTAGALAAAVLAIGATLAQAQYGRRDSDYGARWVNGLIGRVHGDLNRAYGSWRFSGGDRDRLNSAERELRDFARKWNRGRFDKGELDHAIAGIQHVVDNNHMPPGNRDALIDDLGQLRGMRQAYDDHRIGGR